MRKIIICCLMFALLACTNAFAQSPIKELDENTKEKISQAFELTELDIDVIDFIDKVSSGDFEFGDIFDVGKIADLITLEFKKVFSFIIPVIIIVILAALINNIDISFGGKNISKTVVNGVVVLSMINITYDVIEFTVSTTDSLIIFINSLIPILSTMLFSAGKMGTSAVLNPLIIYVSAIISLLVKKIIIPLVLMGLAINLSGEILSKNHLLNFGMQITKMLKWILGIILTVYIGVVGIIGVVAPKIDNITLKTTKYAVSNFIPYVGGMVAESVELILECSDILKSAVGIAGLIGVISIVAIPCINIAVRYIIINLFSFVISPISEKSVVNSVNHISSCYGVVLGMNVIVAVVYIIFITVIIFIGGA